VIPPLRNGDHLTLAEFERRRAARDDQKAELTDGVGYMTPPPTSAEHAEPHGHVIMWLGTYAAATPWTHIYYDVPIRLDERNEPRPDGVLTLDPRELVVEVAYSSASYDLHEKKEAYLRAGCLEYLVLLVEKAAVQIGFRNGRYLTVVVLRIHLGMEAPWSSSCEPRSGTGTGTGTDTGGWSEGSSGLRATGPSAPPSTRAPTRGTGRR
jgi:Uma2 family endonuclease